MFWHMSRAGPGRFLLAAAVALLPALATAQDADPDADAPAEGASAPAIERASPNNVEEMVVTGTQPGRGKIPTLELISEVYHARRQGGWLYKRGRYKEAFPLLLTAAKRGFKFAQARVGFLYQQGCPPWGDAPREPCEWGGAGGRTNADPAIGWLALAAQPPTTPEIRGHFKKLWERIPAQHHPHFADVIANYEQVYGTKINRVGCDRSHKAGTYIKKLTCRFLDEQVFTGQEIGDLLDETTAGVIAPIPTPSGND